MAQDPPQGRESAQPQMPKAYANPMSTSTDVNHDEDGKRASMASGN